MVAVINFAVVFLFAFLPSIIWLIFFLKEDRHPEPKRLLFLVFCAGALASVPVLLLQFGFQKFVGEPLHAFLIMIFGLALIEEVFKFFAAYVSVRKEPAFDEPVDAMIYAVVAALGFATVENLFIMGDKMQLLTVNNLILSVSTLGFRFIGATLLHTLASAFAGYYWARKKIILGLGVATLSHFVFNWLVYRFEDVSLLYPTLFLIFLAIFIFKDFSRLKSAD
jgi:RsiW-degrading membrane proteinase PrsW (M82 family)